MKRWSVLLILATFALPKSSVADCLACWELKGVRICLKNGECFDGYVTWNDAWLIEEHQFGFPEVLLAPLDPHNDIQMPNITFYRYYDLWTITYPDSGLRVTVAPPRVIPLDSLSNIVARPGMHDGYHGAGGIPQVTLRVAKLLLTHPYAFCKYDTGLADIYWISYNKEVDEDDISFLCKAPWTDLVEYTKSFESHNIIRLIFPYD